MATSGQ